MSFIDGRTTLLENICAIHFDCDSKNGKDMTCNEPENMVMKFKKHVCKRIQDHCIEIMHTQFLIRENNGINLAFSITEPIVRIIQ